MNIEKEKHIVAKYPKRYNLERYMFFIQRTTGLFLVAYFYIHIFIYNQRIDATLWAAIRTAFGNPTIYPVSLIFVTLTLIHGANGIRLILTQLGYFIGKPKLPVYPYPPSSIGRAQRAILFILMGLASTFIIIALIEFLFFVR
ncbi:MAG: hypothetical protein RMJ31_06410 [Nitrososphaerota archaeon]|nr:hypothetical protein [Nitrososphaerales archaeon]MDW8045386.1 hypothetical protein [Nitrososphaerota archaeon]